MPRLTTATFDVLTFLPLTMASPMYKWSSSSFRQTFEIRMGRLWSVPPPTKSSRKWGRSRTWSAPQPDRTGSNPGPDRPTSTTSSSASWGTTLNRRRRRETPTTAARASSSDSGTTTGGGNRSFPISENGGKFENSYYRQRKLSLLIRVGAQPIQLYKQNISDFYK